MNSRMNSVDRGEAVNLARNILGSDAQLITDKGIATLAQAVLRMDEALRAQQSGPAGRPCCLTGFNVEKPCSTHCSPALRDAVLEEAATVAEDLETGYDSKGSGYRGEYSASDAAKAIRALKNAAPQVDEGHEKQHVDTGQPPRAASEAGADDARDAARYRWLRDSGLAVAAWQDVGAVHWALNGVEYLSLDEGVDEQIKRQSATLDGGKNG